MKCDKEKKQEREKQIVSQMIGLYCRKQHGSPKGTLCEKCSELLDYAKNRIDRCPFTENKTFCSKCKVHCYKSEMRERIRQVMKYSGPRMLLYHPVLTLKHFKKD